MHLYRHTQVGKLVIVAIAVVIVVDLYFVTLIGPHSIVVGFTIVLLILLATFSSLTVSVDREKVVARFGLGPIHRTIRVTDISDVRVVRNKWWYGWGIRLTPHGWLYNVAGFDAVEMELADDRKVRFGTDQPQELRSAIQLAIGRE